MLGVDQSAHVQIERDRVTGVHIPFAEREDQLEELGADLELEADQVGDFLPGRELLGRRQLQFSLDKTNPGSFRVDFLEHTPAKHQYLVQMWQDDCLFANMGDSLAYFRNDDLDSI